MASKTPNLFSQSRSKDKQIEAIVNEVADIFVKDSQKIVSVDIQKLLTELDKIGQEFLLIEKTYINSKGKEETIYSFQRGSIKKRQLLLKGYLLLQNFRAYVTGSSVVNYRYYVETKEGTVAMVSLSEEEIIQYLKITSSHGIEQGFNISTSLNTLAKKIKHTEQEEAFLSAFNKLYTSIMAKDMQPGYTYGFMVHSSIIEQYGSEVNKTPTNLWNKKGRYQQFNKGHIIEGLDTSLYEAGSDASDEQITFNYDLTKKLFFTKNLSYDRVIGFKGGDNSYTNTQIKASGADLMDYYTIFNQIKKLKNVLTISDGAQLKSMLTEMFIDTTGKAVDTTIDDIVVNKILKDISFVSKT